MSNMDELLAGLEDAAIGWQMLARQTHIETRDEMGQELRRYASQWAITTLDACNILRRGWDHD